MTRVYGLVWTCLVLGTGAVACRAGHGTVAPPGGVLAPAFAHASFEAGDPLPPGVALGRVCRLSGGRFEPADGVAVVLDGLEPGTRTDAAGYYGFERIPSGLHRVSVSAPGMWPMVLAFRLTGAAGSGRLNMALVPQAEDSGRAPGDMVIAGVAVDPRGCALPGATVRLADSLTGPGNATAQADVGGFWSVTLPAARSGPLTSGVASLTTYGRTPGGVAVEAMEVTTVALGDTPTVSLVAATRAFSGPSGLRWEGAGLRRGRLQGEGLPRRRDECVIRLSTETGTAEVLPAAIGADGAWVEWPAAVTPTRLEVLPLGLVPVSGVPPDVALRP
jgi:hypothetical protein